MLSNHIIAKVVIFKSEESTEFRMPEHLVNKQNFTQLILYMPEHSINLIIIISYRKTNLRKKNFCVITT